MDGLFFTARLFGNPPKLPDRSCYGDTRFCIAAPLLFDVRVNRLYFCDFYCTKALHYVTLVLTRRGSPNDEFCAKHLAELNMQENSFLMVRQEQDSWGQPRWVYYSNFHIWVEVLKKQKNASNKLIKDTKRSEAPNFKI